MRLWGAALGGRAAQLFQRWVPASLLPTQGTPAVPHSTPHLAFPQGVRCGGGGSLVWQHLCSGGGLGGSQPGTYLVGRAQRRRWRCRRPLLPSPFIGGHRSADGAGGQGAVSAGWGRRDGLRTHPGLRLSIPVRQCGESGPPAPHRADNESAGLCLRRGSGHNGQRA